MGTAKPVNKKEDLLILIGENLRRIRKQRKWSQEQLANEAELDRTYIGYIENAKYNVTVGTLCDLANALNVEVEDFLKPKM
ncbi:MAG TPA: helix-turn-helix transcriptional regulator [Saprospiraceae bacterium]|nr:helix-turn-helix transcriptional regulator [Saprospiraceae bacterium]